MEEYIPLLNKLFNRYNEIKLVYLFGSQAKKKTTPLSDYDFAIYFDPKIEKDKEKDIILTLITEISMVLKTDKLDLVILNHALSPLLKYNVLRDGILIYQKIPYKILIEPIIYSEYFDYKNFSITNNL